MGNVEYAECYAELANAIVLQAFKDYRKALFKLVQEPEEWKHRSSKKKLERFFHSKWYRTLTDLDPAILMQEAKRQADIKAVTKKIEIDGQMVEFRASAAVPRLYRIKFGRDIYKDLRSLEKSVDDGNEESSSLDLFSLEMFENIAFIMAKHAHPDQVPDNPDEWLENFNTFSIYQILPQLIELWGLNVQTEVEARKNLAKVSG